MPALLNWALRAALWVLGAGALLWILRWLRFAWRHAEERWPLRVALATLLLAVLYAAGHGRLVAERGAIEAGRERYARFGDPRLAEARRAELRGWILDCSDRPGEALALYREEDGRIERSYPLGQAGANLIGGGEHPEARDYTVERLYAEPLRRPRSLSEVGQLHPAGSDLHLTLCRGATARAWELLRDSGRPGAVIVEDVQTGALVAYAATGGPGQPPLGIQEYAAPGSTWKLALSALWWESGLADTTLACPAEVRLTPRAVIANDNHFSIPEVSAPTEMLVYSCNTTAVEMALLMRERLGAEAFQRAYRRFGFDVYTDHAPEARQEEFWRTSSRAWARRMGPPPARVRIGPQTSRAEWGQLAIGQGPVDVTPIHLARFVQAIGNGGVMLAPTLEQAEARAGGGERVMSEATARKLVSAMRQVVERGTARHTRPILQGLDWGMGGKTGTAQVRHAADNGWFAGLIFGPGDRPRYSVVVLSVGGGHGGGIPAHVAAEMTRYFATHGGEGE